MMMMMMGGNFLSQYVVEDNDRTATTVVEW